MSLLTELRENTGREKRLSNFVRQQYFLKYAKHRIAPCPWAFCRGESIRNGVGFCVWPTISIRMAFAHWTLKSAKPSCWCPSWPFHFSAKAFVVRLCLCVCVLGDAMWWRLVVPGTQRSSRAVSVKGCWMRGDSLRKKDPFTAPSATITVTHPTVPNARRR